VSKVKVNKHALDYFRKLSRNTELEIQAYLVGQVVSPDLTVIDYFAYTNKYCEQTSGTVRWFLEDFEKVKKEAEEKGKVIVGDIHSHPNYWPILSGTDHTSHIREQYRISGVCATMSRKTKVCFWIAESSLPCKIVYA
jgi:proteasome lid subunit RPN8/RPN11